LINIRWWQWIDWSLYVRKLKVWH